MRRMWHTSMTIGAATVLATFFVAFSGIGHIQMMSGEMQMSDCPFAPGVSLCDMTAADYIGSVTNIFSAPLQSAGALGLLLAIIALASLFFAFRLFATGMQAPRRFAYAFARAHAPPRTFLQELFSRGILHSKAF